MELTADRVTQLAAEYVESEPLSAVEQEHVAMLPETFASGEYGRRDVEWVVQWRFRRYLGAYPDRERRDAEQRFRGNDFETVLDTLSTVVEGPADTRTNLQQLTALDGVDVPIASAFLQFTSPERYVAVDHRTWRVLVETGDLDDSYPDTPVIEDYIRFDDVCRRLTDQFGVDAWTLYRALWRCWKTAFGDEPHDTETPSVDRT